MNCSASVGGYAIQYQIDHFFVCEFQAMYIFVNVAIRCGSIQSI